MGGWLLHHLQPLCGQVVGFIVIFWTGDGVDNPQMRRVKCTPSRHDTHTQAVDIHAEGPQRGKYNQSSPESVPGIGIEV